MITPILVFLMFAYGLSAATRAGRAQLSGASVLALQVVPLVGVWLMPRFC